MGPHNILLLVILFFFFQVQEKRMALRRRRTRNPKYYSDDFESAFPGKNTGYGFEVVVDDNQSEEPEQTVVIENVEYTQVVLFICYFSINIVNILFHFLGSWISCTSHSSYIITSYCQAKESGKINMCSIAFGRIILIYLWTSSDMLLLMKMFWFLGLRKDIKMLNYKQNYLCLYVISFCIISVPQSH